MHYAPPPVVRGCTLCKTEIDADKPDWVKYCDSCYDQRCHEWEKTPKRLCALCNEPQVAFDAPVWRTVCARCYSGGRDCACGKKLKPFAPKYQKECTTCWLKKRESTHTTCSACTGEKAKQLRRKRSEPFCASCTANNPILQAFKKAMIEKQISK